MQILAPLQELLNCRQHKPEDVSKHRKKCVTLKSMLISGLNISWLHFKTFIACELYILKSTKLSSFTVQCQRFLSLIYMNMADKSQTGLFPEAGQDMTGNSNDSEQNLQLLKFRLVEPKSSQSHTWIRKWHHLQKSIIYGRKGRKTWLTFQHSIP